MNLLDLVFPKRCVSCGKLGSYICSECFSKIEFIEHPVCPHCERPAVGGRVHPGCFRKYGLNGLIVICRYRGPVRAAIVKIKYKWVWDIEKVLVDLIVQNLWKFDFPSDSALVPVPLHSKRKRWRGFNQAELLARDLAKRFKHPYVDLLIRNRDTKPQVDLKSGERKKNVLGAFSLRHASRGEQNRNLVGKSFILVDDVFTTGATMSECAKVLKRAGASEVWAMAVALG
ncbi:ComF family protein [Candidatus Curtissbacteria bacterium]|nr:ComF family protein [Candidatus Curtissbacteria bacterium]